jgi:hypothetical protein
MEATKYTDKVLKKDADVVTVVEPPLLIAVEPDVKAE